MATKARGPHGLNTAHTAGIYSDMTVDGPDIGTLVLIVDRAKNLPNRKSIGKQDPYCAARLGKEAKKTQTDRRGGQTPRWDQEMRFTVYDSPDYYQLKVSIFNDDKKTDIIGETWVNLKDLIVPGGGQNDKWHNLSCKGKYAGEVRIEMSYYDNRPKQERAERSSSVPLQSLQTDSRESLSGPRQQKATPKRRPLPSDPVTGASASPVAMPDYQSSNQMHESTTFIPTQSPLQSVEYATSSMRASGPRSSAPRNYASSTNLRKYTATMPSQHDPQDVFHEPQYTNQHGHVYDGYTDEVDPYEQPFAHYDTGEPSHHGQFHPPSPDRAPPPPPAHRVHPSSTRVSPAPASPSMRQQDHPYESHAHLVRSQHSDSHRHSMPTYSQPQRPQQPQEQRYRTYSGTDQDEQTFRASTGHDHQHEAPLRHHSYDERNHAAYSLDARPSQPVFDNTAPLPAGGIRPRHSFTNNGPDYRFEQDSSPAPLSLNGRGSAISSYAASSIGGSMRMSTPSDIYAAPSSFTSYSDMSQGRPVSRHSENPMASSSVGYGLPSVPPTLVAGMDPGIAKEISERIFEEKRATMGHHSADQIPQTRHQQLREQAYRPHSYSYSEGTQIPRGHHTTGQDPRRPGPMPVTSASTSPMPRIIPRKSVSPGLPPHDGHGLAGVPFGPDSYNALNPVLAESPSASFTTLTDDPDAKIITHDGREIDPSDHIPESNYAPLHESKGAKYASQQPDRNYQGPGASPAVRHARGHSAAPQYVSNSAPSTPPTTRTRLQKKINRMSAQVTPTSSPLAPLNGYQDNNYSPRPIHRASTGDFATNENHAPYVYAAGGGSPAYRQGPPPVPAKVPLPFHAESPARSQMGSSHGHAYAHSHTSSSGGGGGDAWALMEEMRNIDLGVGSSRRRRHH